MINISKKNLNKFARGFSLVEMLVVIAIFFTISSIVLFRQSKFSSDISITNAAYDVALVIREAQVYGTGSKQGDDPYNRVKSYGVVFDYNEVSKFYMYSQSPRDTALKLYDSVYDSSSTLYSLIDTIALSQGQEIHDFCGVTEVGGTETLRCARGGSITHLNIFFIKPDLNPVIKIKYNDGSSPETFKKAKIFLRSALGDKCRTVVVNDVGQINVDPVTPGSSGCAS